MHPDLVEKWVRAHVELTDWINSNLEEAKRLLNQQIQKDTGAKISSAVLDDSFSRLQVTYDPVRASMLTSAKWEFEEGFLGKQMPDVSGMYDLSVLNKVLREKHRKEVE